MKYLFIFLASFIIAAPAYAARQVSGSVPVVKPLQPPSAFANPDFNGNIQQQSTEVSGGGTQQQQAATPAAGRTAGTLPVGNHPLSSQTSSGAPLPGNHIFLWLAAVLALIILGWVWFKQRKSPQ